MGIAYSYECTKATVQQVVGRYGNRVALLCDLEFVDEHGHNLAPVQNGLVVLSEGQANLEQYAENIALEHTPPEEFDRLEALCQNFPGYTVYNSDWLASQVSDLQWPPTPSDK